MVWCEIYKTILKLEKYSLKHVLRQLLARLFRTSCQSNVKRNVIRKRKNRKYLGKSSRIIGLMTTIIDYSIKRITD